MLNRRWIPSLLLATLVAAARETPAAGSPTPVERGKYLIAIMGCHDCHTPKKMGPQGPEPDFTRPLIGHAAESNLPPAPKLPEGPWVAVASWDLTAWSGPWGVSYAVNLTPDKDTGLGNWSEEMFTQAMRTGKHMGTSRPILPPMPWYSVGALEDADLKALWAYLRSVPPIRNQAPFPQLAPPPPPPPAK